jgi:hypothetical protein
MAYATIDEANAYFATRLYSEAWEDASQVDQQKALDTATRDIDRLNFAGYKHTVWLALEANSCACDTVIDAAELAQPLQFPRGSDETIPSDIKIACMEIALARLDGVDPEMELENLGVISQGYASVRTTYDRSSMQDYIKSGIASSAAWRYLKPFLRSPLDFTIKRVN